MNGILQTINVFFESQSGMFWLCVALFVALVFVSVARVAAVGKLDDIRVKLSGEEAVTGYYREYTTSLKGQIMDLRRGNMRLAKIAGDASKEVDEIKYRNTRLYGANEMLADMVTDKMELIAAVGMATERACGTCQNKACAACEIRAMRGLYLEPQAEAQEPVFKDPAAGLPYRSCAWCERADHCREDGGLEYDMPPMLNEKQDVDCYNFSFDEKSAPQEEQPEEPTVCETSCPTCAKNETCDKAAGSGYQPDENGGCGNWENAFPTKTDAMFEAAAKADIAVNDEEDEPA